MNHLPEKIISVLLFLAFASHAVPTNAKTAMAEASTAGRFLFIIFYDKEDTALKSISSTVAAFKKATPVKCAIYNAALSDPTNMEIAAQYGINAANLPMVLTIAPNGAITGGYPKNVTAEQLKQCIYISDLMTRILKPLQEQKVVLAVLQNGDTQFNAEAWQGVNDFTKEYAKFVATVKADPAVPENDDFIKQCQLISPLTQSTVVVLLPPGRIGKILSGKVTKADILASLQSCTPGSCKPGACSDRRFKKNVTPIVSALNKITKLQGVTFTWDRANFPGRFFPKGTEVGLIAQDVETVIPEVVGTDAEGYKSIHYDKLTSVLIEAVKEMKNKIDSQDSVISAQNARIRKLEEAR